MDGFLMLLFGPVIVGFLCAIFHLLSKIAADVAKVRISLDYILEEIKKNNLAKALAAEKPAKDAFANGGAEFLERKRLRFAICAAHFSFAAPRALCQTDKSRFSKTQSDKEKP